MLILAALVSWTRDGVRKLPAPLLVFGQTPLFFYVVHFYLPMAGGFLFFPEAGSLTKRQSFEPATGLHPPARTSVKRKQTSASGYTEHVPS